MKRPLAVFGFAFLLAMLAAVRLPAGVFWVAAALAAAAFGVAALRFARVFSGYLVVALGAALLAFALRAGYDALLLRPAQALAGQRLAVRARVVEVWPGYGEDTVHAAWRLLPAENGPPAARGLLVQVRGIPPVAVGDEVQAELLFYDYSSASVRAARQADGYRIGASVVSGVRVTGTSPTFFTQMRRLQYAASENIRGRLPLRLSAVAAAMAVGDRRFVSSQTSEAYRMAGLSHMMVVSGLHLSLLCALLQPLLQKLARRRRTAAVLGMLFVGLFVAFTGFTPSIVRSGVVWAVVFVARLWRRRADIYTSMGLAAVLLLVQNPYAAADVGLLLSFSATLGALAGGRASALLRQRRLQRKACLPRRILRRAGEAALTPLCVAAATLPVLVWAGMGLSLFSIPMNILLTPLLPVVVAGGLLMALPAGVPVLGALGFVAAPVAGAPLVLLEKCTGLCAALPQAWVPLGGAYWFAVVLTLYALAALGWKRRRAVAGMLAAGLVLAVALGLHAALNAGTVKLVAAGGGDNASLVVIQNRQAAVLYRSRLSLGAVARVLQQNSVRDCVLFIDLRQETESLGYAELLAPRQTVVAGTDIVNVRFFRPFGAGGPAVTVQRQAGGTAACVDVAGYKAGVYTGSFDWSPYAPLDVLLAGSGKARGEYGVLLCGGAAPAWASPAAVCLRREGDAALWVRPGRSVRFQEVAYGVDG